MNPKDKNSAQQDNGTKDDHLSPTEPQNHPIVVTSYSPYPTHDQLTTRLEAYSRIGGMMDQYIVVQELKNKYLNELESRDKERTRQDINYAMGMRAGLPQINHRALDDMRQRLDQDLRNEIAKDAREYYKENNSLSQEFSQNKPDAGQLRAEFERSKEQYHELNKDREMDKI